MGCFTSTTTTNQQTKIPEPTQQEKDLMQMTIDVLFPAYLAEMGYEIVPYSPAPSGGGTGTSGAMASGKPGTYATVPGSGGGSNPLNLKPMVRGQTGGGTYVQTSSSGGSGGGAGGGAKPAGWQGASTSTKKWTIQKKEPADVAYAKEKYGADSKEYKSAYDAWKKSEAERVGDQRAIEDLILENTQKFMNGDFSLNEGQKKFLNEAFAPIKDASTKAINLIRGEANKMEGDLNKAINNFKDEVAQTGLEMGDAITLLENRIKKTGVDMKTALKEEMTLTRKLNEMGLKDFTADQRMRLQNQAVSLGRSSTDPDFVLAMQENVNREIERSNLEIGRYGAEKAMAIAERTGAGMEDAARLRLGVAERTGAGQEEAERMRLGVVERASDIRNQAAAMQGQAEIGMAENKANLWRDMVMGLPTTQIGTGLNVGQYQNALMQQRISNMGSAMQAPLNIYNTMAQERYAQPSVTGTTNSSPSVASMITGLIGTGLSGVGALYGAGMFGGGGGSNA